jgi:hypothetical protein
MAKSIVTKYGMSDLGYRVYDMGGNQSIVKDYSEDTDRAIDSEVQKIINECAEKTREMIRKHENEIRIVAEDLLDKETIDILDVIELIGERPFKMPKSMEAYINQTRERKKNKEKEDAEIEIKPEENKSENIDKNENDNNDKDNTLNSENSNENLEKEKSLKLDLQDNNKISKFSSSRKNITGKITNFINTNILGKYKNNMNNFFTKLQMRMIFYFMRKQINSYSLSSLIFKDKNNNL